MAKRDEDRMGGRDSDRSGFTYRRRTGADGKSYNFNVGAEPPPKKKKVVAVDKKVKIEPAAAPVVPKPRPRPEVPAAKKPEPAVPAKNPTDDMVFSPMMGKMVPRGVPIKTENPFSGMFKGLEDFRAKQQAKYGGMKNGGKVRGDGMSRVKTKGRCL